MAKTSTVAADKAMGYGRDGNSMFAEDLQL